MAQEVLINNIVDEAAINKQLGALNKQLETTINNVATLNKSGVNLSGGDSKTVGEAVVQIEKLTKAKEKLSFEEVKLKQISQEQEKLRQLQAKSVNDNINSYDKLSAKVLLLAKNARDMAVQHGVESKEAQKAIETHNKYEQQLRKIDEVMNNHKRNVGNYEGATVSLRTQMRSLTQTLANMELQGKNNSVEYKNMVMKLGSLKDAMGDVQARAKFFADDQRYITGVTQALGGMVGAYSAYVAAVGLVAGEDEDLQKTMAKMMQLMVLMNGITQVSTALNKDSAASVMFQVAADKLRSIFVRKSTTEIAANTVVTKADTTATEVNSAAKKASGGLWAILITAIITAIYYAYKWVTAMGDLTDADKEAMKIQEQRTRAMVENKRLYEENTKSVEDYITSIKNQNKTQKELVLEQLETARKSELAYFSQKNAIDKLNVSLEEMNLKMKEANTYQDPTKVSNYDVYLKNQQASVAGLQQEYSKLNERKQQLQDIDDNIVSNINKKYDAMKNEVIILKEKANTTKDLIKLETVNDDAVKLFRDHIENLKKQQEEWTKTVSEFSVSLEGIDALTSSGAGINGFETTFTKQFENANDEIAKQIDYLEKLADQLDKSGTKVTDFNLHFAEFQDKFKESNSIIQNFSAKLIDIVSGIGELMAQNSDNIISEIERTKTADLDRLEELYDKGIILQADYERRKEMIEKTARAKGEKEAKAAFEKSKKIQMTTALINFASMQLNIWGTVTPWYLAAAESLAAGILATIQIEKIRNSQFPGYAKGRKGGAGELAYVGEEKFEYISTDTGLYKTPNTRTLTYLPAGADVIPHNIATEIDKYIGMPVVNTITKVPASSENAEILKTLRAIERKPNASININKHDFNILIGTAGTWQRHIETHVNTGRSYLKR